jgi:hypothetical protein
MANINGTDDMELQTSKDSISSVERTSEDPKTANYQEKHVAQAYPVTTTEGPALKVCVLCTSV